MKAWSIRVVSTRWGYVGLAASSRGVEEVTLPLPSPEQVREVLPAGEGAAGSGVEEFLVRAAGWLEEYSRRPGMARPVPISDLAWGRVSEFAARVYGVLLDIPPGETLTYGQVAARLGCPRAARAVGRACALNPWPLLVPCHRVVGSRDLGGYGGGRALKEALLLWERENR